MKKLLLILGILCLCFQGVAQEEQTQQEEQEEAARPYQAPEYRLALRYSHEVFAFQGDIEIDMVENQFEGLGPNHQFDLSFERPSLRHGFRLNLFHDRHNRNRFASNAPNDYHLTGAEGEYQHSWDLHEYAEGKRLFFLVRGRGGLAIMQGNSAPGRIGPDFSMASTQLEGDVPIIDGQVYVPGMGMIDPNATENTETSVAGQIGILPGLGWTDGEHVILLLGEAQMDWEQNLTAGAQIEFRGPIIDGQLVRWTYSLAAGWRFDLTRLGSEDANHHVQGVEGMPGPCQGAPYYYGQYGNPACVSELSSTTSSSIHQVSLGIGTGLCAGARKEFCLLAGLDVSGYFLSEHADLVAVDTLGQHHGFQSETNGMAVNATPYVQFSWAFDIGGNSEERESSER